MSALRVTRLTESDVDDYLTVLNDAFLGQISSASLRRERRAFAVRAGEHFGAFDGAELVGVTAAPTRPMTLPGGVTAAVSAVTSVAVSPSHRRRGVFSALVHHQLAECGTAISALWPSQGSLYSRFGYAPATRQGPLVVAHGAAFRPGTRLADGRVRELPRSEAAEVVRKLHLRIAPHHAGWVHRDEGHWTLWLEEPVGERDELRFAVHEDGYLVYRVEPKLTPRGRAHELHVRDLAAADPAVYAALWRHVLDLDLGGSVHFGLSTLDEPLPLMLADPRMAEQSLRDGMWVRVVDLPGALTQRRYRSRLAVTMSVTDALLPANAGRWRLTVDDHGVATVASTRAEPELSLDIADLGAAYLGVTSWTALAAAGRVRAATPQHLAAADLAFGHTPSAHCTTVF